MTPPGHPGLGPVGLGLIWAQDADGVIGSGNRIPWRLPEDQARFKATTLGAAVIMGRATWLSLPAAVRPLPGRRNIVLSRRPDFKPEGAVRASTVAQALDRAGRPAWVMGGEQIYTETIELADTLIVTVLAQRFDGDRHAPHIGPQWRLVCREPTEGWLRSSGGLDYRMERYRHAPTSQADPVT